GCFPYDEVIEDNDRLTKLGYNASLAITFPLQSGGEIYVEGRFHRMDSSPATEYVPVVIGYRW
ncbi:MAG: hypothetical protein Q8Q14_08480, partial [Gemmatimonadales bacterium]|nr:hypothetical protein [Gemmatimonadales bacterium]